MLDARIISPDDVPALRAAVPIAGPRRILVVEQEGIFALDIAAAAEGAGHEVVALARTEAEALAAAEDRAPDVAIVDLHGSAGSAGRRIAAQLLLDHGIRPILVAPGAPSEAHARHSAVWPVAVLSRPWRDADLIAAIARVPPPQPAFLRAG